MPTNAASSNRSLFRISLIMRSVPILPVPIMAAFTFDILSLRE